MDLEIISNKLNELEVFNIPIGLKYYLNYLNDYNAASPGYSPFPLSLDIPKYSPEEVQKFANLKIYFESLIPEAIECIKIAISKRGSIDDEITIATIISLIEHEPSVAKAIVLDSIKNGSDNDAMYVADSIVTTFQKVYQLA